MCLRYPQLNLLTMNRWPRGIREDEDLESSPADTGSYVCQSCQGGIVRWESTTSPDAPSRKATSKITSSVELEKSTSSEFVKYSDEVVLLTAVDWTAKAVMMTKYEAPSSRGAETGLAKTARRRINSDHLPSTIRTYHSKHQERRIPGRQ